MATIASAAASGFAAPKLLTRRMPRRASDRQQRLDARGRAACRSRARDRAGAAAARARSCARRGTRARGSRARRARRGRPARRAGRPRSPRRRPVRSDRLRIGADAGHSGSMPAFLMMLFHFSDSAAWNFAELGGRGGERIDAGRSCSTAASPAPWSPRPGASCSLLTTAGGVFAGTYAANQNAHVVALDARFADRRAASGASGERFGVRHAERAHLAALHLRQAGRHVGDHHVDLPAEQIVDRERIALVRHVQQLDAGHLLEHLAGHARRRAAAAEADLAGLRLRERDELGDRSSPARSG